MNPDNKENRIIQIWVTPEKSGESAGYKLYYLQQGKITHVYGGDENQDETFASKTTLDVSLVDAKQTIYINGEFVAYVTLGNRVLNGIKVANADLVRGHDFKFQFETDSQIIIARKI